MAKTSRQTAETRMVTSWWSLAVVNGETRSARSWEELFQPSQENDLSRPEQFHGNLKTFLCGQQPGDGKRLTDGDDVTDSDDGDDVGHL